MTHPLVQKTQKWLEEWSDQDYGSVAHSAVEALIFNWEGWVESGGELSHGICQADIEDAIENLQKLHTALEPHPLVRLAEEAE